MKHLKFFIVALVVLIFIKQIKVEAVSIPHYFAYNLNTSECGDYRPSDENYIYSLSNGWVYVNNPSSFDDIKTKCVQMNLKFSENIPLIKETRFTNMANSPELTIDQMIDYTELNRVIIISSIIIAILTVLGITAVIVKFKKIKNRKTSSIKQRRK